MSKDSEQRDPLWERVWASVTPDPRGVRFAIEVRSDHHRLTQTIIRPVDELAQMPGAFGYVLDKMVRKLDEAIHA